MVAAYIGGVSDLGQRLRARGKRLTSQRERVLGAVGRLGHATPDDIVDAVASRPVGRQCGQAAMDLAREYFAGLHDGVVPVR